MTAKHNEFTFVLVHGFLGTGADWDAVRSTGILQAYGEIYTPTLPGHGQCPVRLAQPDLRAMTDWLVNDLHKLVSNNAARSTKLLLVGYSLGGRILLNLLAQLKAGNSVLCEPAKIAGMVVESAHPGLPDEHKETRRRQDRQWSQRFAAQPITEVLSGWYQQEVFSDLQEDLRAELVSKRSANEPAELAKVVISCSLAEQPDYRGLLLSPPLPLHYWYGALDRKFRQIALNLCEFSSDRIAEQRHGCGHAGSTLTVTKFFRAGHNCHLADPVAYARQLAAVLSELAF